LQQKPSIPRARSHGAPVLRRSAALALICAVIALTSGCSMLRFGYDQADHIAAWKADEYFDLDPGQKNDFIARFERLHAWHRRHQLPDYARFLSAVQQRAQQQASREDAVWLVEGVRARYRALVTRASSDAASLLATLTPENIRALQRQWQHDNRRFVRTHRLEESEEERRQAGAEHALKQIREWTGHLEQEQETRIIALHADIPLVQHLRHQDRLRRQREFLQLLETRGSGREFEDRLRDWLMHWDRGRAPEYERLQALAYEKRIAFYLAVERMLTPRQRATLLARLQNYIEDFQRLADRDKRVAGPR
jgi:hypothetical protein